jgi:hypothetical protein
MTITPTTARLYFADKIDEARFSGRLYFTNATYYYIHPVGADEIHIIDMSPDIPTMTIEDGEWAKQYIANNRLAGAFYRDNWSQTLRQHELELASNR